MGTAPLPAPSLLILTVLWLNFPAFSRDDDRLKLGIHTAVLVLTVGLCPAAQVMAQGVPSAAAPAKKIPVAIIRSVRVVRDTDEPAIEILSTGAVIPTIQKLQDPIRLVIDVPNSRVGVLRKRLDFRSEKISGIRVDQYQNDPPITRVVVDLAQPSGFTWD